MKTLLALVLSLISVAGWAQVQMTVTSQQPNVKPGKQVDLTLTAKNPLTPKPAITFTVTGTYTGLDDVIHPATPGSVTLTVIQPLRVETISLPFPLGTAYVAGSGKIDGVAAEPTIAGGIATWSVNKVLNEQQTAAVTFKAGIQ